MRPVDALPQDRIERLRRHLHERIQSMTGQDQTAGIEIASLIHLVANQYNALLDQAHDQPDALSGPRWGLLLRMVGEEERGNQDLTPTYLSRCQNVSKNTISSLLRGLEEQGMVTRELDAHDHRIFRMRLTPNGRRLIHATAPLRMRWHNQLVAQLTPEEKAQLIELLSKLYLSMTANFTCTEAK